MFPFPNSDQNQNIKKYSINESPMQLGQANKNLVQIQGDNNSVIIRKTSRVELDHVLFQNFLKDLPSNGSIHFVDETNMSGFPFQLQHLDEFHYFL